MACTLSNFKWSWTVDSTPKSELKKFDLFAQVVLEDESSCKSRFREITLFLHSFPWLELIFISYYWKLLISLEGFPGSASGKEPACQCRRYKRWGFRPPDDPLEKGMATHSSIHAWRIPWAEEPADCSPRGSAQSDRLKRLSMLLKSPFQLIWVGLNFCRREMSALLSLGCQVEWKEAL